MGSFGGFFRIILPLTVRFNFLSTCSIQYTIDKYLFDFKGKKRARGMDKGRKTKMFIGVLKDHHLLNEAKQ
jgi:hypothetical protein